MSRKIVLSLQREIQKINTMALAIKAIPTLIGEDAIRFREEMERNEQSFQNLPKKDREKDPFIIEMREMLKRSGF